MFENYAFTAASRFLRYVQIDTQSDPDAVTFPSTEKQKTLGNLLVMELLEMGISAALLDEFGYVQATIPSNTTKKVPVILFCAHMDTSPDCSGFGVKPIIHEHFSGADIILPDDPQQVISVRDHPYLLEKIGDDIITASGTTLLGADDKAGVAVVMDMIHFLQVNAALKHGEIRIVFTPDEEIGKGVDKLDVAAIGAQAGYTLDGGELGCLETETFSADQVTICFKGVGTHPGYAKDKMINATKVAAHFISSLPADELSPESTDGRYGFVHPVKMTGTAEQMTIQFIVRDFITAKLGAYEDYLRRKMMETLEKFPGATSTFTVIEQYRNMQEVLDQYPQVSAFAELAIQRAGLLPIRMSARGGTDGSRLSFLGIPCPNIFTGEMAFHGKHEYVSIQDMQKSVETIVHLTQIWEEKS